MKNLFLLPLILLAALPSVSFSQEGDEEERSSKSLHPLQRQRWVRTVRYHLIPPEKMWRINGGWLYTQTSENYGSNSESTALPSEGLVQQHNLDIGIEYAWKPNVLLGLGTQYRFLSGESTSAAGVNNLQEAFGLSFIEGLARYRFHRKQGLEVAAEARIQVPMFNSSNTNTTTDILLGSGSTDTTIAGVVRKEFGKYGFFGSLGFRSRSLGFSSDIPYTAEFRKEEGDILFGAKLHGFMSNDSDGSTETGGLSNDVPSFLHNAVNPTSHQLGIHAETPISDRIYLRGVFDLPISGTNSWSGYTIGAQFSYIPELKNEAVSSYTKEFREYSLTASVVQVSSRVNFIKIDKGSEDTVKKGQSFEIYEVRDGVPIEPVAFGKILRVKSDTAILKVLRYYKEVLLEEGMLARRVLSPES